MRAQAYRNRREAGRLLGLLVRERYAGEDAVVLALPRGGVPVGFEVARALGVSLEVFLVRKLGLPDQPEVAMGAIASGGYRVLFESLIREAHVTPQQIAAVENEEWKILHAREALYRRGNLPVKITGRTLILVDDGLATGYSMRAAIGALKEQGGSKLVVAIPVGAPAACVEISREVDALICPMQPTRFLAVGFWYEDFSATTDEEVCALLEHSTLPAAGPDPKVDVRVNP